MATTGEGGCWCVLICTVTVDTAPRKGGRETAGIAWEWEAAWVGEAVETGVVGTSAS